MREVPSLPEELVPAAIRALDLSSADLWAAFDADGVLWHGDVSDDFAEWMAAEGLFSRPLWEEFVETSKTEPRTGWRRILRLYAGLEVELVRVAVRRFWETGPDRSWVWAVHATVQYLARRGVHVVVVSATPAVVFEPFLQRTGAIQAVLGIELETRDGRFTGEIAGVPSVAEGKATRLRQATDSRVVVAAGNSLHDIPLLGESTGVSWAVNPDEELQKTAAARVWLQTIENQTDAP